MAQFRPFAIKTGSNVPVGTTQYQNILVGVNQQNYNELEYDWIAGPDEDLGYVIAFYDADGDTFRGARIGITNCKIGFLRSKLLTDSSFLELVNYMRTKLSLSTFNNSTSAKSWLTSNGYWTSFGESTWAYGYQENAIGGAGWFFYASEGPLDMTQPPMQNGNSIFLTTSSNITFNPNTSGGTNQLYFNRYDNSGIDYNTQFDNLRTNGGVIHITQNGQTVSYSGAANAFMYDNGTNPPYYDFLMISGNYAAQLGSASSFVYGDPIILTFN